MFDKIIKIIIIGSLSITVLSIIALNFLLYDPSHKLLNICKNELPNKIEVLRSDDREMFWYKAYETDKNIAMDKLRNIYIKAKKANVSTDMIQITIYDQATKNELFTSFINDITLHKTNWEDIKTYSQFIYSANIK